MHKQMLINSCYRVSAI